MPKFHSLIFLILVLIISIIILISIISIIECTSYKTTFYKIKTDKLNQHFRIVFLSDFHNKKYKNENDLIFEIENLTPDIIILGGDFIEYSRLSSMIDKPRYDNTLEFIKKISKINFKTLKNENDNKMRIFFSLGNHENRLRERQPNIFNDIIDIISKYNIKVLDNCYYQFSNGITISGISLFDGYYGKFNIRKYLLKNDLDTFSNIDKKVLNIALFHKPDYAEDLIDFGYDIVLSGHNHGGLIKTQNGRSLFSPDLKFLPKYNYGKYIYKSKNVIVTSGLGEHFIKIRVNNHPEIVVIDING